MKTVKIAFIVMMFPLIDARMFIIDARIKKGCPGGGGYPTSGKIQTYFIHIVKLPEMSLWYHRQTKLPLKNIYGQLKVQELLHLSKI